MKNILQYLWQTDRTVQTQTTSHKVTLAVGSCLVVDKKLKLKWYFYSGKQSKTLKKKPENTSPELFLKSLEQKRSNGYAGLFIQSTHNKLTKHIINNTDLIDLALKPAQPFIFVDLSWMKKVSLFEVHYQLGIVSVQPTVFPTLPQITTKPDNLEKASQSVHYAILSFVKAIEENLTMNKSVVKELRVMVAREFGNGQAFVWLLWGDVLKLNNDYYGLGYQYQKMEFMVKQTEIQQQEVEEEEWECEGCLKELNNKRGAKEVCQEDAIFIRTQFGVSKYGLMGKEVFQICHECVQILRNK